MGTLAYCAQLTFNQGLIRNSRCVIGERDLIYAPVAVLLGSLRACREISPGRQERTLRIDAMVCQFVDFQASATLRSTSRWPWACPD